MIIELPNTTTQEISKRLVSERNQWGAVALGRVLTLVIDAGESDPEPAIEAANLASRQNPCRVIVLSATSPKVGALDAQIRVGSDAGAGEVILLRHSVEEAPELDTLVLPLFLPDAPVVAWWPGGAPKDPHATPIGRLAMRRITSSQGEADPAAALVELADHYTPGDTDLAWTRTTIWRGLIAAALDQPPFEPVERAVVTGERGHPSLDLLATWLAERLRCPVELVREDCAPALTQVRLDRASGPIIFNRPDGLVAELTRPNAPVQTIPLPIRGLDEAVAEELRRLGQDSVYGEVLEAYARQVKRDRREKVGTPVSNTDTASPVEELFVDPAALQVAAATRALEALRTAGSETGADSNKAIHWVLTGGGVGIGTLREMASHPNLETVDWPRVHIWWGDERFVPDGDAERNETQARDALLDELVAKGLLKEEHIHPMPASDVVADGGPEESARLYSEELEAFAGGSKRGVPAFDLLLLGMGPDGHIASLFPGNPGLNAPGAVTGVWDSPKPPPERVSLTFEAIQSANEVWLLAAGAEKREAVASARSGASTHITPAAGARGRGRTLWMFDEAAASLE